MGDLIDRQAVIDAICDKCLADCTPCKYFPCGEIKAIQALPSVQPNLQPTCNNLATDAISRQAAIGILYNFAGCIVDTPSGDYHRAYKASRHELELLPSAQPEIVRCKDCKYCEHWYADKGRCFLWHEDGISVFEDGFCNYAERRPDG